MIEIWFGYDSFRIDRNPYEIDRTKHNTTSATTTTKTATQARRAEHPMFRWLDVYVIVPLCFVVCFFFFLIHRWVCVWYFICVPSYDRCCPVLLFLFSFFLLLLWFVSVIWWKQQNSWLPKNRHMCVWGFSNVSVVGVAVAYVLSCAIRTFQAETGAIRSN